MNTLEAIMTRKSVRSYAQRSIPDADLEKILRAGQAGPSCTDARDWAFLVVRDREILGKMSDANGAYAQPARLADTAILVCGDLHKAFSPAPDYWIIDGAIACQNMILAAHGLGIGSVWLGTYPQMERVEGLRKLFDLPGHIVPHSILAFGYEQVPQGQPRVNRYDASLVHYDHW